MYQIQLFVHPPMSCWMEPPKSWTSGLGSQMLNNIANDLDMLLSDLCQIYPYPHPKKSLQDSLSSDKKLLEEYITGASDETSTDSGTEDARDRQDSVLSAHLDVFRLDDVDQSLQIPQYDKASTDTVVTEDTKLRPITTLERLTKTHPIWFLTDIGRMGAVHLLKDRQAGSFIVRRSSQNKWALSVQFPQRGNANIDHYLIEGTRKGLRLQGSNHYFPAIPNLVSHYCDNLDELPLQLVLPPAILAAKTPQELMSLALLGQDFWTSPLTIQAEKLAKLRSQGIIHPSPSHGLHKSCSEPISIKQSMDTSRVMTNEIQCNTMPFYSTDNFSTFLANGNASSHWKDLRNNNDPQSVNLQEMNGSCSKRSSPKELTGSDHQANVDHHIGGSCDRKHLKQRTFETTTGPPFQATFTPVSRNVSPKISNQSAKSASTQTSPKEKPPPVPSEGTALYGTTALDFLTPPYPGYYSSNLSDRMSDYYDVWKNTVSTPTPERKSVDTGSGRAPPEQLYDLEKQLSSMDLLVTGKPPVGPQHTTARFDRHHFGTSQIEQSKPPRVRPPPLPTVSRLKSCSIPSLTGFKSPVYSQPFDALCDGQSSGSCDDLHISSRHTPSKKGLRRQRSLPPRSLRERRRLRSPQLAKLDPIISPPTLTSRFLPEYRTSDAGLDISPEQRPVSSPSRHGNTLEERRAGKSTFYVTYPIPAKNQGNRTPVNGASKCFSDSAIGEKASKASFEETCFLIEDLENSVKNTPPPTSPSLNKFPVDNSAINRRSYSDSSTVEDLISHTAPQCTVKSLQPLTLKNLQRVSEYDNLMNPYRPSSVRTASSIGTVFCKPWDSSPWQNLLQSESPVPTNGSALLKLPVESSVPEKIIAWQDANQDYEKLAGWDDPVTPGTADTLGSSTSTLTQDADINPIEGSTSTLHNADTGGCLCRQSSCELCCGGQLSNRAESKQSCVHGAELGEQCIDDGDVVALPLGAYVDMDECSDDDLPLPSQGGVQDVSPSFQDKLKPFLSPPRLLSIKSRRKYSGVRVREYIYSISQDQNTTFGCTISNFIQCTKESKEQNPQIVMRNVRQFMNGIKNYLVKHGEGELEALIELEREKLEANEILNIDAIIEGALHKCVIHPLKHHIYKLFVEQYNRNGSLKLLSDNIKYARTKTTQELGIKAGLETPTAVSLEVIKNYLLKMQKAYSPLKKLENLLGATSSIYHSVQSCSEKGKPKASLGADDFLPMFIYVLVHCGLVSAEIEAEYMWGLLHPSILTGEGGYYLTTLSSAVLVLRNMHLCQDQGTLVSRDRRERVPSICDTQGFLKVVIPDELHGSITWRTLPVRANMNTRDVCIMLAHKLKVTNPQDYGLYLLTDGNEKHLVDSDCPHSLRNDYSSEGKDCVFAYKRLAANIAWPKTFKH
ncbi:uncharacterized protein LOC135466527 isoform X2 [Liolophura sinensis]|uniref:uncharacterized protein LOC135466527 isoform X2 n=1 Tax=Liolophura sinensis TaxID=3198878 RepID=UPI0031596034